MLSEVSRVGGMQAVTCSAPYCGLTQGSDHGFWMGFGDQQYIWHGFFLNSASRVPRYGLYCHKPVSSQGFSHLNFESPWTEVGGSVWILSPAFRVMLMAFDRCKCLLNDGNIASPILEHILFGRFSCDQIWKIFILVNHISEKKKRKQKQKQMNRQQNSNK